MGILDQTGSQTLTGSWVVKSGQEPENDSVLFEDNNLTDFGLGSDVISIPNMPAELETFASSNSQQEIDFNQVTLIDNFTSNFAICNKILPEKTETSV